MEQSIELLTLNGLVQQCYNFVYFSETWLIHGCIDHTPLNTHACY